MTLNRATLERCAKGFVVHVDRGAGLLGETYAFNYACEADDWLNNLFTDEGYSYIGSLNIIDTARLARGEITLAQAASIARSNMAGEKAAFAAQMAEALAARQRNRDRLATFNN